MFACLYCVCLFYCLFACILSVCLFCCLFACCVHYSLPSFRYYSDTLAYLDDLRDSSVQEGGVLVNPQMRVPLLSKDILTGRLKKVAGYVVIDLPYVTLEGEMRDVSLRCCTVHLSAIV